MRFYYCVVNYENTNRMITIQNIKGRQVKDLITKFFYKDNHLCFQILLHLNNNRTIVFQEFTDYTEYKSVFNALQQARAKNSILKFPNDNFVMEPNGLKVAWF